MTKIHFQNLRSKNVGKFFGQKIENLKFSFFKLTFRRKHFREKNRSKNIFRPIFFLEKKSSKSQLKKWNFRISEKKSDNFPKIWQNIFDEKKFRWKNIRRNFFGHVYRSQIFQRFQKSHLENYSSTITTFARGTVQKTLDFASYPRFFAEVFISSAGTYLEMKGFLLGKCKIADCWRGLRGRKGLKGATGTLLKGAEGG